MHSNLIGYHTILLCGTVNSNNKVSPSAERPQCCSVGKRHHEYGTGGGSGQVSHGPVAGVFEAHSKRHLDGDESSGGSNDEPGVDLAIGV